MAVFELLQNSFKLIFTHNNGMYGEEIQPQSKDASHVFKISNCLTNVDDDIPTWSEAKCVTLIIEWVNYLILTCLLAFLLTLHCLMYTRINKKCSVKILKRNRVQILILSVCMTSAMFIKLTFLFSLMNLILLLLAQLLRFLIWSLTLINFLKSGMDLVTSESKISMQ